MAERLLSVGLDVGTTTTQVILSQISIENRASGFAVPKMEITGRQVLYRGKVHFTPLIRQELVDAPAIRAILEEELAAAGFENRKPDSGAVIITGETSRKENAAAVLQELSDYAGDFVVATAGPDLESVLAAKGAGAVAWSEQTGKKVLHMDIGGGTANLALIREGQITETGCLNVGGRLLKYDREGRIYYISPVLQPHTRLQLGDVLQEEEARSLADLLCRVLLWAAGLGAEEETFRGFITADTSLPRDVEGAVLSFSGGVADCIENRQDWTVYGDLGPLLGQCIRESALCAGEYRLGAETIRATVIGAGCHSAALSGSTVFSRDVKLPVKNLPVTVAREEELEDPGSLRRRMLLPERWGVLALKGFNAPSYEKVLSLADSIAVLVEDRPCYVALEEDMAKALGHALSLRIPPGTPCLCLDGLQFPQDSYLDVGRFAGPALPVVIKTLVLENRPEHG